MNYEDVRSCSVAETIYNDEEEKVSGDKAFAQVLIVDDDFMNIEVMKTMLES